jgi:hypothetical protein
MHGVTMKTHGHYNQYMDTQDERRSPPSYVTVQEMHLFLAIIVQMGHNLREMLKD